MNPSSRRLTFVVGTSLLTATLVTGCKKSGPTVNPAPEQPHVNTAAPSDEPAPDAPTDEPTDEPSDATVNTAPSE